MHVHIPGRHIPGGSERAARGQVEEAHARMHAHVHMQVRNQGRGAFEAHVRSKLAALVPAAAHDRYRQLRQVGLVSAAIALLASAAIALGMRALRRPRLA